MTDPERRHAPLAVLEPDGSVFDWYSQFVAPGDRTYYQVLQAGSAD